MSRQPHFILALCFVLGIFFQEKFALEKAMAGVVAGVSSALLGCLFFKRYFWYRIRGILLGFLFFALGILLHFCNTFSWGTEIPVKEKDTVIFKISQKLNASEKYNKYEGTAEAGKRSFNAVFYVSKSSKNLDFMHYYKAEAYIVHPRPSQYDFQFDYAKYLKRRDIEYQCYLAKEISSVEKGTLSFTDKIRQQRLEILRRIDETAMSGKTKGFLKGIILADRTGIDPDTAQDFNKSGLVHLLAISGTHIVIIFGMFYLLLTRMIPLSFRRYAVIISLLFIWAFAGFIGFGNSVLRSCIMLSVYFIFVLLQRKPDLLHSLALSAFIILIFDTRQLFDVGFQLSFLAVLGIFWLNQPLLKYFPRQDHYLKKLVFNTITISLSAQAATLPLVLYYFHQFSFISIVANFIIVPFSEMIIVFSFVMTVLIAFSIDFGLMNMVYDHAIQFLLESIHWFAEADLLFFENISMNLAEVLSIFLIVYFLRPVILKSNFKNVTRFTMAVLGFIMIRTGSNAIENQKEEILFHTFNNHPVFSVKQGSRACFWIADIADQEKVRRFIVNPYCSSRRVGQLEIKTFPSSVQKVVFRGRIYEIK